MERWQVFAKAQEMYAIGVKLLSLVLEGTDCTPLAGYANFNEKFEKISSSFPAPVGRRTAMTLVVHAPKYNHAVGVIFNNEEKTFSFIDSSHEEEHSNPQRIISLLREAYSDYTYVSIACPRDILPQKTDGYCTMWSYFLLVKSCGRFILREYLRNTPRDRIQEEFMQFIDALYNKFIVYDIYMLYLYYQQTLLGLYLSKEYTRATELRNTFRNTWEQKKLLDDYQQYITLPTQMRRTYNQAFFLVSILVNISQVYNPGTLLYELANVADIREIVEILSKSYDGRYLLTETLHRQRRGIELGILAPVISTLYDQYYRPYKEKIAKAASTAGIDLNASYVIASLLKRNAAYVRTYYIYPMLAGMTNDEYQKARTAQYPIIAKDINLLQQYLFYVTNGGQQSEFIFGQITGNEILPLPENAIPIRRRPYIEMLFLYHMSSMFHGKNFLPYVNIENINDIEGRSVTNSHIVYALTKTLNTLGIKYDEYHRIPRELRSLFIRYYLPAQTRMFEFSVLSGLNVDNMDNLYTALEEKLGDEKLDDSGLEAKILYDEEPIEKIVDEYLLLLPKQNTQQSEIRIDR